MLVRASMVLEEDTFKQMLLLASTPARLVYKHRFALMLLWSFPTTPSGICLELPDSRSVLMLSGVIPSYNSRPAKLLGVGEWELFNWV